MIRSMSDHAGIAIPLRARIRELEAELEALTRTASAEIAKLKREVETLRLAIRAMEDVRGAGHTFMRYSACAACFDIDGCKRWRIAEARDTAHPEGRDANGSPVG